ncbi:hypothetical protein LTR86_010786 [Recurvomyces mirabilis]|nr:hypothetical protein LTR86_010786 [Recurvomyces mirabilis]
MKRIRGLDRDGPVIATATKKRKISNRRRGRSMSVCCVPTDIPSRLTTSTYRALDRDAKEIRVLVVHRGKAESEVNCSLRHVWLAGSMTPTYETVSYVWGSSVPEATIRVDGHDTKVTASAERVIRRFRLPDKDRVLWIDAICINQTDIGERSQQVAMMQDIYSNTTHNLVWLGEDDGSAASAKRSVSAIADLLGRDEHGLRQLYLQSYGGSIPVYLTTSGSSEGQFQQRPKSIPSNLDYDALATMYMVPWFTRIWDQKHGVFGSEWDRQRRKWVPRRWASFALLQDNFRGFHATDPRDQVFAILGLWLKTSRLKSLPAPVLPDYSRPVIEVFVNVTRFAIEENKSPDWMRVISHRQHDILPLTHALTGLPTWMLPWHVQPDPDLDPSLNRMFFNCSGTRKLCLLPPFHGDESILSVLGTTIDIVAAVSETLRRQDLSLASMLIHRLNGFRSTMSLDGNRAGDDDLDPIFAVILSGGGDEGKRHRTHRWAQQGLRALLHFLRQGQPVPTLRTLAGMEHVEDDLETAARYQAAMGINCFNRRFLTTTAQRHGLGPQIMEPGDVIAILYSCTEPMVLRKRSAAGHYSLVSPAYLHGCMNGEALRKNRNDSAKSEEFHIH